MLTALGLPGVRLLSFDTAGELPSATFACLLLLGVPLLRRDSLPNMLAAHEEAISILTVSTNRVHEVAHIRCCGHESALCTGASRGEEENGIHWQLSLLCLVSEGFCRGFPIELLDLEYCSIRPTPRMRT